MSKKNKETGSMFTYEDLIRLGSLDTSDNPFVQHVKKDLESLDERLASLSNVELSLTSPRVQIITKPIELAGRNKGIGYLASSISHDAEKESLSAALIAHAFINRKVKTEPLIVPIDNFYKYNDHLSFVGKTKAFNYEARETGKRYAILLTGFTQSSIFTQEILEYVPHQRNADLLEPMGEFGQMLYDFKKSLWKIFYTGKGASGNIDDVLNRLKGKDKKTDDAKLLLATGLLLNDIQTWQDLWYEKLGEGTPLYIIAPVSFHDAMNRLNMSWGHGAQDYYYRASRSLHSNDEPLLDKDYQPAKYSGQGLPLSEFKQRVERFLASESMKENGK